MRKNTDSDLNSRLGRGSAPLTLARGVLDGDVYLRLPNYKKERAIQRERFLEKSAASLRRNFLHPLF